jgi:hypothetical protein
MVSVSVVAESRSTVKTAPAEPQALEHTSTRYPRIAGAGDCDGAVQVMVADSDEALAVNDAGAAGTSETATGMIDAKFVADNAVTRYP